MTKKERELCDTFYSLCETEPDASTEQLLTRTADIHHVDYMDVVDALAVQASERGGA